MKVSECEDWPLLYSYNGCESTISEAIRVSVSEAIRMNCNQERPFSIGV